MTRARLMLCSLLSVALFVPACGGGEKKEEAKKDEGEKDEKADEAKEDEPKEDEAKEDDPAPEEKDEPADANATLTLGAAKIYEADKKDKAILIGEDGSITAEGEEGGGSVTADGKLMGKDGTVFAELKADGTVMLMGQATPVTIDDKGVVSANDKKMSIGEDGKFVADPADDKVNLQSEGCTGEMARTCMFVMMGMLMPAKPIDSASAGGAPAQAPAAE